MEQYNSRPTRRTAVGAVAAGALAAPAFASAAAQGQRTGFALIGAGAWGQVLLAHSNRIRSARCIAVCDPDETSARKAVRASKDSPQAYKDYREALGRKDVEAVVVATPLHTHFAIVRDALLAGKHVHCEPPLVFKAEEARALKELADARDQVVQVGLQRRYSKFYQTARQMAAKGFLGEVTNIQAQCHRAAGWAMNRERPRESNWRLFREYSGGLVAEYGAHQIDIADWVFGDSAEFVTGVGSLDWKKDGRDIYDTVALIFRYPDGRQMIYSAISTNAHLSMFGGMRSEAGEMIIGTEGTIEITIGTEDQPALGLWYYEPSPTRVSTAEAAKEIARVAGATVSSRGRNLRAMPILLERDQITGDEPFLQRELKYARRWLYAKGMMVPEEERHPVELEMESFFECCREGTKPKASLDVGLKNAAAVVLANRAMNEGRRVPFTELVS